MNGQIGGPSVKPYMPPGIWRSISNASYKQDKGDKLYRRGMYTYWRRTVPPPTMMTFNAAAREVCIVRTDLTTTPLQALTLMNNKTLWKPRVSWRSECCDRMPRRASVSRGRSARWSVGSPPRAS